MKTNYLFLLTISLCLAGCKRGDKPAETAITATQSDQQEKVKAAFPVVDKIFHDHFEKNNFPGLAFGVIMDGQLVYANSFGVANTALKIPATTRTNFRIASMSKSFTAMAILKLRDEGKLALQDPVSKYIPALGKVRPFTTDAPAITIEHLLTMSAGFPEDNPWGDRQLADTDEDLIKFIEAGISFSNAPGLVFEYSNLGFGMLGRIVSVVSGRPYQQYITENILKPLKMNDARWEYTEIPKEQLALGYRWEDEQWKEEPLLHDGIYGAMGGLICSVEDFSKYVQFHLSAWPPRDEAESQIIKRSSLREMHQLQRLGGLSTQNKNRNGELCPMVTGYGYGLAYRRDCNLLASVRHGGGLPGYGSEWRFFPELGVGIVSLSNLTYGGLGTTNAHALDTLIYLANLKPRTLAVSSILLQRQKEIMDVIQTWPNENLGIFAENFFLDQSLENWKKSTAVVLAETGKISNMKPLEPENQLRGIFLVEGEKKDLQIYFTLTPESNPLIQRLDIRAVAKSSH